MQRKTFIKATSGFTAAQILCKAKEVGVAQCHIEQDRSPDPIDSIGQSIKHFNSISG